MNRVAVWVVWCVLASAFVSAQAFNVGVVVGNVTNTTGNSTSATIEPVIRESSPKHGRAEPVSLQYSFPVEIWAVPGSTTTLLGTITNPGPDARPITLRVEGATELVVRPMSTTVPSGGSLQVTFDYTPKENRAVSAVVSITDGTTVLQHHVSLFPDVPPNINFTITITDEGLFRLQGTVETVSPIDIRAEIRESDGTVREVLDTRRIRGIEELEWGTDLAGYGAGTYQGCLVVTIADDVQEQCQAFTKATPEESFPLSELFTPGPDLWVALAILLIAAGIGFYRVFFVMK